MTEDRPLDEMSEDEVRQEIIDRLEAMWRSS